MERGPVNARHVYTGKHYGRSEVENQRADYMWARTSALLLDAVSTIMVEAAARERRYAEF